MKYICFGYYDENAWAAQTEAEQNAFMDECFDYDDKLRANGHIAGGEALDIAANAVIIRHGNGKVTVTDGPFAETKEQIGGLLVLEARDLNEAIALISNHPGIKAGPFEIRPVIDMAPAVAESEKRRGKPKA